MSITNLKTAGNWALPPTNNNVTDRPLTGRVIFGMLTTGTEGPEPTNEVVTSEKDRRR